MLPLVHSTLERLGEINFGATTRLTLRIPRPAWAASARKTIVVIGAGLAGLGAAEQLRRLGHQVIMLEAH
jgi:NADPH-dependent 2,4-dienoyl-CoA reductase/sulfur reductase-like enzyme